MKHLLLIPLSLGLASALPAQETQSPGILTTYYASDFGYGGAMFDLTPQTDLRVTAFDANLSGRGFVTVDVYYAAQSSFGIENDPQAWTLLDSVSVNARGTDLPSSVRLNVEAPTFAAGQTYAIYLELQNVSASNTLRYTNAPSTSYANSDLELVTNCAKAAGGIAATTFQPREFNGSVYYTTLDGITPELSANNFIVGQTARLAFRNGTPGATALIGYSLHGPGPTTTVFGVFDLSAPIRRSPLLSLDSAGAVDFSQLLPAGTAGVQLWAQGIDLGGGLKTNSLSITIQ